jgi:uncharacterized membrane protein
MKTLTAFYYRFILFRNERDRVLLLSMSFSVLLACIRVAWTGRLTFLFLVWNLFLAYVPYVFSTWLQQRPDFIEKRLMFTAFFIAWLLFIPNAFYLLTDLFHLGNHPGVPLWFDLALIGSFAWNGLLLGIISVLQMEKIVQVYLQGKNELLFIYPVMWLNALGIYIGRYLRFNSWDIITNPFGLFSDISVMALHPLQNKYAWGMILCFSVFMTVIYITIKRIGKIAV